jgi:hypothetical protein
LSINCYELAISILTKNNFPINWAEIQENIAVFYAEQGKDSLAISKYLQSLEVFHNEALPISSLKACRGLGGIYFKQGNWQKAIETYKVAMQSAETSRSWSIGENERQRIVWDALSVYENAIQCAVELKNYTQAIEYTERVRARQLVDFMATNSLGSGNKVEEDLAKLLAQYEEIQQQIQAEQRKINLSTQNCVLANHESTPLTRNDLTAINATIKSLESKKQIIWQKIRRLDPTLAIQKEIVPIDLATIQTLISHTNQAILSTKLSE